MTTDRLKVMFGVWLGVFPAVMGLSYLLRSLDWPLWASTLVSTSIDVPIITFLVVPLTRKAVATAEHKDESELKA